MAAEGRKWDSEALAAAGATSVWHWKGCHALHVTAGGSHRPAEKARNAPVRTNRQPSSPPPSPAPTGAHLPADFGVGAVVRRQRAPQQLLLLPPILLLLLLPLAAAAAAVGSGGRRRGGRVPRGVQQRRRHDVLQGGVQLGEEAGVVGGHGAALRVG